MKTRNYSIHDKVFCISFPSGQWDMASEYELAQMDLCNMEYNIDSAPDDYWP